MALKQISSNKCFGGQQKVFKHVSVELNYKMKFAIYLTPKAETGKCPALYWLSGKCYAFEFYKGISFFFLTGLSYSFILTYWYAFWAIYKRLQELVIVYSYFILRVILDLLNYIYFTSFSIRVSNLTENVKFWSQWQELRKVIYLVYTYPSISYRDFTTQNNIK